MRLTVAKTTALTDRKVQDILGNFIDFIEPYRIPFSFPV